MDGLRNPQVPFVAPKAPPKPPTGPPKPGSAGWKQFTADRWHANHPVQPAAPKVLTPTDQAMGAFRTALAQVNAATPPVDSAAIYAPYRASEAVTGQLGTGYQQAMQNAGTAASSQYTQGLNDAQQAAAAFGISAGAGANPTQLNNSGTAPIAAQTQAGSASAAAATAQWQALLERTAGAKVADATVARDQGLTAAKQSLATALPGLIGNEKDRAFQAKSQRENMGLAYTQLDAKQKAELASQGIDIAKLQQQGKQFDVTAWLRQRGEDITANHNKVTEGQGAAKIKQGDKALAIKQTAAQKKATASGIKGISQVNSILKPPSSTSGAKPVIGYKITLVADSNGAAAGAPNQYLTVKDPNSFTPPADWTVPTGTAPVPVYGQAGTGTAGRTSLASWNRALSVLQASNPGVPVSKLMPILGQKPKK